LGTLAQGHEQPGNPKRGTKENLETPEDRPWGAHLDEEKRIRRRGEAKKREKIENRKEKLIRDLTTGLKVGGGFSQLIVPNRI